MTSIIRQGIDLSAGHCFNSSPAIAGSTNVFINNIGAVRVGDSYSLHKCRKKKHIGTAAQGSPNVFVNNKPIHRQGDLISCGDIANNGSSNVFANSSTGIGFLIDNTAPYANFNGTDIVNADNDGPTVLGSPIPGATDTFFNTPLEFYSTEHDDEESTDYTSPPLTNPSSYTIPKPIDENHQPPNIITPPSVDCSTISNVFTTTDPNDPTLNITVNTWQELFAIDNPNITNPTSKQLREYYDTFAANVQLSPNFTLADVTTKPAVTTYRLAAVNGLSQLQILYNLCELSHTILEPLKQRYGTFLITSGFRNKKGSSQHNIGKAVDIQFPGFTSDQYWDRALDIKDNIPYKMMIMEYGKNVWFHLDIRNANKKVLTQVAPNKYQPGLIRLT